MKTLKRVVFFPAELIIGVYVAFALAFILRNMFPNFFGCMHSGGSTSRGHPRPW